MGIGLVFAPRSAPSRLVTYSFFALIVKRLTMSETHERPRDAFRVHRYSDLTDTREFNPAVQLQGLGS